MHSAVRFRRRFSPLVVLAGLLIPYTLLAPPLNVRGAQTWVRYFPETGHTLGGVFLDYWEHYGGLASYGYPITDPFEEDGRTVQYFERARFEQHPEYAGTRAEVLLGLLGVQLTATRDFPPAERAVGAAYFDATRHTLRGAFLAYWQSNGGLARFGYPISEEFVEPSTTDGKPYTVQYFERVRFEHHPENRAPYDVLLGQLGAQMLALRTRAGRFLQALDGQLVTGADLRAVQLKGFNYYPRDAGWTPLDQWPWARVDFELAQAQRLGANALRVFVRYDAFGGPAANWSRQENFRRLVDLARRHGCYLVITLFDGIRKPPAADWDRWPAAGSAEEASDRAYLAAVVGAWKDEPTIALWDLVNDADYVNPVEWQWQAHRDNRIDWLYRTAAEVHRLDPNHQVTVGLALRSSQTLPDSAGRTALGAADVVSIHYYAHNDRDKSPQGVLDELRAQTRKPLLIEEVGEPTYPGWGDEASQVALITRVMQGVAATHTSGALVWSLYDWPAKADGPEGNYGLLRADDSEKPAAAVFRQPFAALRPRAGAR